jgi:RNA polymerase sigma-70 factor (ECF subfamily)
LEEIELIKKVQQGDMAAFEKLFECYKQQAVKTVYLMTNDKNLSEDIVQDAFVTCYFSIKNLKEPALFKTWFFKIVTRRAWRVLKKEKRLVPVEEIYELVEAKHSATERPVADYESEVYHEILKLDYKLQTTLILYYYNELTIKEIAKTMGCLEGTVKSRLYTGRKKLKVRLGSSNFSLEEA